MYRDAAVKTYLDDLASSQPTPGGGSAAALSGAMAAGLASMVVRLTLGKSGYEHVQQEMETLLRQTERLRERFERLMQEDIDAYGRLSTSFKLPRGTEDQRTERTRAIQERLAEAAQVPLEIAECAAELTQLCVRIAEIGNKNVLSDVAVGAMLASGAGNGAAWMVRTNLKAMKDTAAVQALHERLLAALDHIDVFSRRVASIVGERA
jgi:formiminotetrahydrofolate cyclodeaminase